MSSSQFGFRQGLGTREAIVELQVLGQNCYNHKKDVCLGFINYEKAFDWELYHKLIQLLGGMDLDQKDIRFIENLYWHQSAHVRLYNGTTNPIQIKRGVCQRCVLSPLLFNIYSEAIFQEALEDMEMWIKVNRVRINNIHYADDTILIAYNVHKLQQLNNIVGNHSQSMELDINTKKTKYMIVYRNLNKFKNSNVSFDSKSIERVVKSIWLYVYVYIYKNQMAHQTISSGLFEILEGAHLLWFWHFLEVGVCEVLCLVDTALCSVDREDQCD